MIPLLLLAMAASGAPSVVSPSETATPEMEKLLQDCDAHKFETVVNSVVDGKPHQSKVKLCGTKGQSDAAWVNTLRDAVAKVKANDKMPSEIRDQIASALDAELLRLGSAGTSMALIANGAPTIVKPAPSTGIASLAPRTTPGPASARPLSQDYGNLPPLPAPKPALAASAGIGSVLPSLPPPRMRIQCSTTDDPQDLAACSSLYTNSLLTVRADEAFGDTSLRFTRRGNERAEVQLAQMQAGQSKRIALPPRVCQGVARSEVEIEVVRHPKGPNDAGMVVDTLGPYDLRC
jgi:hypothetical protein